MHRLLLAAVLLTSISLNGCNRDMDILNADDFYFVLGDGNALEGFAYLKVWQDGTVQYTFPEWREEVDSAGELFLEMYWKRADFVVDESSVEALRAALHTAKYWSLRSEYVARDVHDGRQVFVSVRASGRRKEVHCDNVIPEEINRIIAVVDERIKKPHEPTIATAETLDEWPEARWPPFE